MTVAKYSKAILLAGIMAAVAGCSNSVSVPTENVVDVDSVPTINPDYTSIVLPPNIAPMNFEILNPGDCYVVELKGADGLSLTAEGKSVRWDMDKWHEFLEKNAGKEFEMSVYVKNGVDQWKRYRAVNTVAPDSIDPYFSYRLIEPSYTMYGLLTINQRNLTNFDESVIFNNTNNRDESRGYCINCHVPRNQYSDKKSQFHVRQFNGGTLLIDGSDVRKINLKTDSTISAGVYQAWHPTQDLIAYSVNETHQRFFLKNSQKVEVIDGASDVILYDINKREVCPVAKNPELLETFPAWNPTGDKLYYSVARYPEGTDANNIDMKYDSIRYDILVRDFDLNTHKFSEPDTVVFATERGRSALLPRVSPDGRYLLFCEADHGTFHIWHKDSDLFVKDLTTVEIYPLEAANSDDVDSYHSWSSNGRWIVFSSRRDDGSYTRSYITYFSPDGKASKAFVVPQEDPAYYHRLMKSYNVPEFMTGPFEPSRADILKALESEAEPSTYKP